MVILPYMMPWCAWRRNGICAIRWLTDRETLATRTAMALQQCGIQRQDLERLAEHMLDDIEKDTVDFQLNFDDSEKEPTILPTRIPQLLINGSSGIAVGMATNIMPHNLSEVIDGCIAFIDNREITIEELMQYVKAPDFPTGGIIYGMEGVKAAMHFGRGRVVVRGKLHVDAKPSGREQIIITEVPYQVNRDALTNRIGELVNEK